MAVIAPDVLMSNARPGAVKRYSRIPLYIGLGIAASLALLLMYAVAMRNAPPRSSPQEGAAAAVAEPQADVPVQLGMEQQAGVIPAGASASSAAPAPPATTAAMPPAPAQVPRQVDPLLAEERERRLQIYQQAMSASTTVAFSVPQQGGGSSEGSATPGNGAPATQPPPGDLSGSAEVQALRGLLGGKPPALGRMDAANGQTAKEAWLSQVPQEDDYLKATRTPPLSRYEIKAGTVIPAVMISGIHSDIPGQLLAQVSMNIYDTVTGRYLLIPAGAKLIGTYDTGITYGQERLEVAWSRIIYPDGSSLDLGRMPGTDPAGYAGFHDRVNDHLLKLFGQTLMISLLSSGFQLSQPQVSNNTNYNSTQILAAGVGQNMAQLGQNLIENGMNVAPTIIIRNGYLFDVQVTQDIVIPPWQWRR